MTDRNCQGHQENNNEKPIRPSWRLFVEEYLVDFNGKRAAIRAGYSEATAHASASRMLKRVKVRALIDKRLAEMSMPASETLHHLTRIARGSLRPFLKVGENGQARIDLTSEEAKENLDLLKSVKEGKYGIEIQIEDRMGALQLIGKHQRLFTDTVNQFDFDLEKMLPELSEDELQSLINGEDPMRILVAARARRAGETPAGGDSAPATGPL